MSFIFTSPFFWTSISMFMLVIFMFWTGDLKIDKYLDKYPFLKFTPISLFELGRLMLVLPFCPQPRFEAGIWHWWIGSIIFVAGVLVYFWSCFSIKKTISKIADEQMPLITTGIYGIVRHPACLALLLYPLGWSIMFRSYIGIALVPFWWFACYLYTIREERSLDKILGQSYQDYREKVPSRIIPGLPF